MPKALIIGSEGQDGTLLKSLLTAKQYEVWCLGKQMNPQSTHNARFIAYDLATDNFDTLRDLLIAQKPDEIYVVAAYHHSSQEVDDADLAHLDTSLSVNYISFLHILELCRRYLPGVKIVYASSSLIFSGCGVPVQNEQTVPEPRCLYSATKCAAMDAAKYYRGAYHLFISVAILYNHESIYRKDHFLSKKIIQETRRYVNREIQNIMIGDLSAVTDWGYAPDYVQAMWHMLQLPSPDVFIVSSGIGHRVQDWFEVLFSYLQHDWKSVVVEDKTLIARNKPVLIGDSTKLRKTGWTPAVSFEEMVIRMYNNMV